MRCLTTPRRRSRSSRKKSWLAARRASMPCSAGDAAGEAASGGGRRQAAREEWARRRRRRQGGRCHSYAPSDLTWLPGGSAAGGGPGTARQPHAAKRCEREGQDRQRRSPRVPPLLHELWGAAGAQGQVLEPRWWKPGDSKQQLWALDPQINQVGIGKKQGDRAKGSCLPALATRWHGRCATAAADSVGGRLRRQPGMQRYSVQVCDPIWLMRYLHVTEVRTTARLASGHQPCDT